MLRGSGMTQDEALKIMLSGKNVFLTGSAGSGKSWLTNLFVQSIKQQKQVATTASTGIAATQFPNGRTVHSWSGTGILDDIDDPRFYSAVNNTKKMGDILNTQVLIIDEISMLTGAKFSLIDQAARRARHDPRPFGGMQVVLVGDFFQLPPVGQGKVDWVFETDTWQELDLQVCYLEKVYRQEAEDPLTTILNEMRTGFVSDSSRDLLVSRKQTPALDYEPIHLYPLNQSVDMINEVRMADLDTESRMYKMRSEGNEYEIQKLMKDVNLPIYLEVKLEEEVVILKNAPEEGYVNGTQGQVIGWKKDEEDGILNPIVKIHSSGLEVIVKRATWKREDRNGHVLAELNQLPLKAAWAITVHKSQGMTLNVVQTDLSQAFTPGLGYVALSRVKSLDGLYLLGINEMALRMSPTALAFDKELQQTMDEQRKNPTPLAPIVVAKPVEPANLDNHRAGELQAAWQRLATVETVRFDPTDPIARVNAYRQSKGTRLLPPDFLKTHSKSDLKGELTKARNAGF